ncbi:MAG: zinc ribbon domain-containing protein [Ruminococcus sp.]|nr:zinc ribbon domain-containing protein [Ruminococcus sp.]
MECPYCGREVQEGAVYCECGRPVNIAGASAGASAGPATTFQQQLDSQTLDSVKRKVKVPVLPIVIMIVALIAAGVFLFLHFRSISNITKEDTWETVNGKGYTIVLPAALKENTDKMLTVQGSDYTKLAFYTSGPAAVYIERRDLTAYEKETFSGLTTKQILDQYKTRVFKINDQEIDFKERNGYLYFEYDSHKPNYIGDSDEVQVIEAMRYTSDYLYEFYAYCDAKEKDKYRESMFKWLDSFTPDK